MKYAREGLFEAEFKKRREEIHYELSVWLKSDELRSKVFDLFEQFTKNHETVTHFSRRLLENGHFTTSLKSLTNEEITSTTQQVVVRRWNSGISLAGAAVAGGAATFLGQFLINKLLA